MSECNVFVDETGGQGGHSKYFAVTLVIHEQDHDLSGDIARYRKLLSDWKLQDIPFYASPLINGHNAYSGLDVATRKRHLTAFFMFFQHAPIRYKTFLYKRSELIDHDGFVTRIKRDIITMLFDNLAYFQTFDAVRIYYDGAQRIVSQSLRQAFDYALFKDAVLYRKASPEEYRLAQAADFLCTMELTAQKYRAGSRPPRTRSSSARHGPSRTTT